MTYRLNRIATYIFGCGLMLLWIMGILRAWPHLYEMIMPNSHWYVYNWIQPVQSSYASGEAITFVSSLVRYKPLDIQRQNTLFCNNNHRERPYPTQFEPLEGMRRSTRLWVIDLTRTYNYPIDYSEIKCIICGTTKSVTTLWYDKSYSYCTRWFGVNGHPQPKDGI